MKDLTMQPPIGKTGLVAFDGWWGCDLWMIAGEPPTEEAALCKDLEPAVSGLRRTVERAGEHLGESVEAHLQPARFLDGGILLPIGASPDFAVDPAILLPIEATARIYRWAWVRMPMRSTTGDYVGAGALTGYRYGEFDTEFTAVVAPVRYVRFELASETEGAGSDGD